MTKRIVKKRHIEQSVVSHRKSKKCQFRAKALPSPIKKCGLSRLYSTGLIPTSSRSNPKELQYLDL